MSLYYNAYFGIRRFLLKIWNELFCTLGNEILHKHFQRQWDSRIKSPSKCNISKYQLPNIPSKLSWHYASIFSLFLPLSSLTIIHSHCIVFLHYPSLQSLALSLSPFALQSFICISLFPFAFSWHLLFAYASFIISPYLAVYSDQQGTTHCVTHRPVDYQIMEMSFRQMRKVNSWKALPRKLPNHRCFSSFSYSCFSSGWLCFESCCGCSY